MHKRKLVDPLGLAFAYEVLVWPFFSRVIFLILSAMVTIS